MWLGDILQRCAHGDWLLSWEDNPFGGALGI
jgi:hypothetical protein